MKKIINLFFFFVFSCSLLIAQEKSDSAKSKLSLGFIFTPNYTYRRLNFTEAIDQNYSRFQYMQQLNQNEIPFYSFGLGVVVEKKINNLFYLSVGLTYDKFSYRSITLDTIYYLQLGFDVANCSGPILSCYSKAFKSRYYNKENFFNLPIELNLSSGHGKVKFIFGAGISVGVLKEKYFIENENGKQTQVSNPSGVVSNFIFNFNLKAGIRYALTNNIALSVQPGFSYFLNTIDVAFPINKNIYSFGLSLGCHFNL